MAPRARRGDNNAEPDAYHEFGVRGRKTGVFLPDRGERDEYGMQPIDNIFSSPQKDPASPVVQDESGSEDMDIASSAGPGPRTLLKGQRNIQFPIPRSRSPAKTHLMSPAKRNPHVARTSSPIRGSVLEEEEEDEVDESAVNRRLDYAARSNGSKPAKGKANGVSRKPAAVNVSDDDDDDDDEDREEVYQMLEQLVDGTADDDDDVDLPTNNNHNVSEIEEEPVAKAAPAAKRGRGRPKRLSAQSEPDRSVIEPEVEAPKKGTAATRSNESEEEPVQRRRGRPPKNANANTNVRPPVEPEAAPTATRKRRSLRNSLGDEDSREQEQEAEADEPEPEAEPSRQAKRQRTQGPVKDTATKDTTRDTAAKDKKKPASVPVAPKPDAEKAAPKPKGRPKKAAKAQETTEEAADAGEASFVALQRGPPMPKSRGLVSVRRDPHAVTQTRSGRHSYQPLHWWRGEEVVRDVEEQGDLFYRDQFVVSSVKEVVRVPEEEAPSSRRRGGGGGSSGRSRSAKPKTKSKQRRAVLQDDEEPEEWELNEGTVTGEVVMWEPEHEQHPPADDEPVHVTEDQIAVSADAVQTTQIRDGTFRFAKTLTMPFMGSGIVDLPPGAEKRPKNSRKMHMVFFVHYGKVVVTVNEAQFRISAGGTWFVPRGNYYSISNDYDIPCRIFFAQACEVLVQPGETAPAEASQSMMSMA